MDTSKDSVGAAPLLITLLRVEMTEKQLAEKAISSVKLLVLKKSGLVKKIPLNEPFDPTRHNVVFHVPDASKPEGTFAHVLKSEYTLSDRVKRPAEVCVTCAVGNQDEQDLIAALPEKPWFCTDRSALEIARKAFVDSEEWALAQSVEEEITKAEEGISAVEKPK
ncbi:hypothetical protein F2Q69_00001224 [Brassica cretica]|uniref:Uncharacterized protein n=1 Tax=Brassica cretica TaxID=69181 RepID=A0A8S9PBE2_BRACR|nr:hypothetical protein F2Q69_00001224 [Brassica cretica]